MAWVLLAVFVALAGTTALLWRAQVKRQNQQAFAAQAASIGASVTTAVQRMDDLTLAARTMLGSRPDTTEAEFANWYRSIGVDERFSGVAGFGYVEIVRQARRDTYPPGQRAFYCLSKLGIAGPGMADTLSELASPGLDLCQITNLLGDTRDSGTFSAIVVTSSQGHEMFEVVAPVYRGGGVPGTAEARRKLATGWIIGLFDAEPILRAAAGRQTGVAVSLQRDHVVRAGVPHPDRRRRVVPHASPRRCRRPRSRATARSRRAIRSASACRSRPTVAGTSPSPAPNRTASRIPRCRPRSC